MLLAPRTYHTSDIVPISLRTGCSQGYSLSHSLLYPTTCLVVKLLLTLVELGVETHPTTASLLVWGLFGFLAVLLEVGLFPIIADSLAVEVLLGFLGFLVEKTS